MNIFVILIRMNMYKRIYILKSLFNKYQLTGKLELMN